MTHLHEYVFLCSQREPPKDEDCYFEDSRLISEKISSSYKYFVNFSSLAIQLVRQCRYQINNYRGVFRTYSNCYDGAFCENSQRLKEVNYFCKRLHRKCSNWF